MTSPPDSGTGEGAWRRILAGAGGFRRRLV